MDRQEVKNVLMSFKTQENEAQIDELLRKIDKIEESSLQDAIKQIGGTEESLRKYFERKLEEQKPKEKQTSINKLFSYGITGDCVHLHLPMDLHQMIREKGISGTLDTVNLYLLDAIDRIKKLKDAGYYKLDNIEKIYMISPVLVNRELKFLENLDFETNTYSKKQLRDESFVKNNPEAQLATHIFGNNNIVGTAIIPFDTINTKEWQDKKLEIVKAYAEKGITLDEDKNLEKNDE